MVVGVQGEGHNKLSACQFDSDWSSALFTMTSLQDKDLSSLATTWLETISYFCTNVQFFQQDDVNFSRNFVLEILLDSILTTLDTFLSVRIPYTISKNDYSQYSIVILIIRLEVLTTYGSREAEAIKNFAKYCFCLFAIEFQ